MISAFDDLAQITNPQLDQTRRWVAMRGFAEQLRWKPTYELLAPVKGVPCSDHLIVEHGLSNSAALSFLQDGYLAEELSHSQIRNLLTISYNNLVDWHFFVSKSDAVLVNNLTDWRNDPQQIEIFRYSPSKLDQYLTPDIVSNKFVRSKFLKSCDDALIDVVEKWKRLIKADIPEAESRAISTLFNALFFVRGCEDRELTSGLTSQSFLLNLAIGSASETISVPDLIVAAFSQANVSGDIGQVINLDRLSCFSHFDKGTLVDFLSDLYRPRNTIYDLNFAILSKHALSRIYEKFVAIFVSEENPKQLAFINPVPEISNDVRHGSVYTPQFVASFFSRFIRDHVTARQFRSLRSLDPACGSGIFLRSLLELQCNPLDASVSPVSVGVAFANAKGVDRDENAIEATKLSLALLHLVTTNRMPANLGLIVGDSIALAQAGNIPPASFDAILTNPPYIKLDHLVESERTLYVEYLGEELRGRVDAYLAFMKLCLDGLSPGGLACFVLPQMIMSAENAQNIRARIASTCEVRCLIDLSSIRIFDGVGTYSILLIVEKLREGQAPQTDAIVGHATDFIGEALQAVLENRATQTPYYRIFHTPQRSFASDRWLILGPEEQELALRMERLPKLGSYAEWRQGFATGNDKIFIRPAVDVPKSERRLYMQFLPDRQIGRYRLPTNTQQLVFYPFLGDEPIDELTLRTEFPEAWSYLRSHEETLRSRKSVGAGDWWRPTRPRGPETMRRPKIVCPHLMLTPRFSVDRDGRFAVKRAPMLNLKPKWFDISVLNYFCAVLNSPISAWYIKTYVPSFDRGYSVVEPKLLADLPVPRFEDIPASEIEEVSRLVEIAGDRDLDEKIGDIIMEHYGLTVSDLRFLRG